MFSVYYFVCIEYWMHLHLLCECSLLVCAAVLMNCIQSVAPYASWLLCVLVCVCVNGKEVASSAVGGSASLILAHAPRDVLRETQTQSLFWRSGCAETSLKVQSGGLRESGHYVPCPSEWNLRVALFFACVFCFLTHKHTRFFSLAFYNIMFKVK